MKLHYISLILAACLSTVFAQSLDGLPNCAKDCATGSIPKQCQPIDVACICGDKSFINNISCCVANKCSKDQQNAVIKFASQICGGAGINDLPKGASCTSGSSSATETSSGSSASNKSATTATGTAATSTSSKSESDTKTSSTSASSATTSSGGAALVQGKGTSLFAAIGAAVFAFLA